MSMVEFPKPFGWLRDGGEGGALAFQREPLTEMQNLAHSTAAVYRSQDVESYAAARVAEALTEAATICAQEGREWDSDAVVTEKNYAAECGLQIMALIPPNTHPA